VNRSLLPSTSSSSGTPRTRGLKICTF
jgi:hypothetical protein